jgi:putative transposase
MSELPMLSLEQFEKIKRHFPYPNGVPRVDDLRVISGIIYVLKGGLRWSDAPAGYGPYKTLYNRFVRWSRKGVFNKIFESLVKDGGTPERLMIDATHLKAHRTAASLLKKGMYPALSDGPKAA